MRRRWRQLFYFTHFLLNIKLDLELSHDHPESMGKPHAKFGTDLPKTGLVLETDKRKERKIYIYILDVASVLWMGDRKGAFSFGTNGQLKMRGK